MLQTALQCFITLHRVDAYSHTVFDNIACIKLKHEVANQQRNLHYTVHINGAKQAILNRSVFTIINLSCRHCELVKAKCFITFRISA